MTTTPPDPATFFVERLRPGPTRGPAATLLPDVLDDLAAADDEHFSVAVVHESGWTVGVYARGRVIVENVEDLQIEPVHADGLARDEVLEVMWTVAAGQQVDTADARWRSGYGR